MTDWKGLYNRVMQFSRLDTLPVGMKYFEKKEDLPSEKDVKRPRLNQTLCQLTAQARLLGRPMIGLPEVADRCSLGTYAMGFGGLGEEFRSGSAQEVWGRGRTLVNKTTSGFYLYQPMEN